MIETFEHETRCLVFTALDGWVTNKLNTFRPTTLPRRIKCRPRARCNIRRSFQNRSPRTRHQDSTQQTHFRKRHHEEVHQGSVDFPGALHNKLGVLTFSASSPVPASSNQETRCQGPRQLLLDIARKSSGEGPLQSRRWSQASRNPQRKGTEGSEAITSAFRSPSAPAPIPPNLAMRAAESPDLVGSKATVTVLCRHSAETKRSVHRTFGLASQISFWGTEDPTEFTYETQASVRAEQWFTFLSNKYVAHSSMDTPWYSGTSSSSSSRGKRVTWPVCLMMSFHRRPLWRQ